MATDIYCPKSDCVFIRTSGLCDRSVITLEEFTLGNMECTDYKEDWGWKDDLIDRPEEEKLRALDAVSGMANELTPEQSEQIFAIIMETFKSAVRRR